MQDGWKTRHPFTLGQQVWVKPWAAGQPGAKALDPATPYRVAIRGENERGPWVTLATVTPYEFAVADFTATPPMPAASEAAEADADSPSGEAA